MYRILPLAIFTLLVLGACQNESEVSDNPAAASSQGEKAIRLLSLGGGITEIVYALGAEELLVGVDSSSLYPAATQSLPQLSYYRTISAEPVLALGPDLILAASGAGPPAALQQLEAAGVQVEVFDTSPTVEGARERIRKVAKLLSREERGEALVESLDEKLDEVKSLLSTVQSKPKVLFVYARGLSNVLVSGQGTAGGEVVQLAGGINALEDFEGYRPLTAEAVVGAAPEVLVVPALGADTLGGESQLLALPGIAQTPAGQSRRVILVDDLKTLGFGPRLGEAVLELAKQLHPELSGKSLEVAP